MSDFEVSLGAPEPVEGGAEVAWSAPIAFIAFDATIRSLVKQHGHEDTSLECGGVLVGSVDGHSGLVHIQAAIRADGASRKADSLRFTHEVIAAIHQVREQQFPGLHIVGWYHTHPGYGIFLSADDQFMHQNFFDAPYQVAYVIDPIAGTEGMFAAYKGRVLPTPNWVIDHGADGTEPPPEAPPPLARALVAPERAQTPTSAVAPEHAPAPPPGRAADPAAPPAPPRRHAKEGAWGQTRSWFSQLPGSQRVALLGGIGFLSVLLLALLGVVLLSGGGKANTAATPATASGALTPTASGTKATSSSSLLTSTTLGVSTTSVPPTSNTPPLVIINAETERKTSHDGTALHTFLSSKLKQASSPIDAGVAFGVGSIVCSIGTPAPTDATIADLVQLLNSASPPIGGRWRRQAECPRNVLDTAAGLPANATGLILIIGDKQR